MNQAKLIKAVGECDALDQSGKDAVIEVIQERAWNALDRTDEGHEGTSEDVNNSSAFAEWITPEQREAFTQQHPQSLQAYQRLKPELQKQTHFDFNEANQSWEIFGPDNDNNGNIGHWTIGPQRIVNEIHPPEGVPSPSPDFEWWRLTEEQEKYWEEYGIVQHFTSEDKTDTCFYFNLEAADRYIKSQTGSANITLAQQAPHAWYSSQFANLLDISLTSWSHSNGYLYRGRVGYYADLWLDQGYLYVYSDDAWVIDGCHRHGHSLLLSDTSFDT